jgi:DNA polymerase-3 subunit gamma/tau
MRLRDSSHARTLVEMALVRLGRLDELLSVSQLVQQLSGELGQAAARPGASGPAVSPPEGLKKNYPSAAPEPSAAETLPLTPEKLPEIWARVLQQVGAMLASELNKANLPAISGPNALVIRFPEEYNQAKEHCQAPDRIARVEQALGKVLGQSCSLRVEGESRRESVPKPPVQEAAPAGAGTAKLAQPNPREEAAKQPFVRRAMDVFAAQVVRADPGFGEAGSPSPTAEDEET